MNKQQKALVSLKHIAPMIIVLAVIILSVFAPALLSEVRNKSILEVVEMGAGENSPESFRYSLTSSERLYIVSMALKNRNILQSDYAASLREKAIRTNKSDTAASYAYVENGRAPAQGELSADDAMKICETELSLIIEEGLGMEGFSPANICKQTLYSAVDMLEPQKNVSVWQIEYDSALPPTGLPFSLMEAYVDAETGTVYSFSFRISEPVDFEPEGLVRSWLKRMDITEFDDITDSAPLIEADKRYNKFATEGMENEKTVFTAGFYEGVNEVFINCY